jgi:CarD family transcriptional regulator
MLRSILMVPDSPFAPLSGLTLTVALARPYNTCCFSRHMNQFEIGDKVVYPNHGVGIIEKISNRLVAGKFERFYLLRICSNDILVMVPTANAGDVGLRKIIEKKDVTQLLTYLASDKFFTQRDWKDRFKENSERMRSGSIFHVAEVFKNLVHLSRVKPLSFREKRMLDRARFLLISELSTVMSVGEGEIEARIEKAVTKACGKGPAPAAEA